MAPDDAGHLDEATMADFLDAELPAAERERVAAHLEECSECRAELRELSELAESAPAAPATAIRSGRPRGISKLVLFSGALAASIAGVAVVRQMTTERLPASPTRVRAVPEGSGRIEVLAPLSRDVPRSEVRFVWRSSNVDAYQFTLTTESGQVLFTSPPTSDTTIAWPPSVPQALGGIYFWSVDGISGGIVSSTGARRLRIAP